MYQTQNSYRTSTLLTLLVLLLFSLFNLSLSNSKWCHPYDEKVLLEMKKEIGNHSSLVKDWEPRYDCCLYWMPGINCDRNGHVRGLFLEFHESDEAGRVPPSIGRLTFLQSLTIARFKSTLPRPLGSAICNLTNLVELTISDSPSLSGSIPSCLGRTKNLTALVVSNNSQITGTVPTSLGQLSSLLFLDLSSNNLSGPIPDSLGRLRKLKFINLKSNRLSGSIPSSLGFIPNITYMSLEENRLSGPIPKSFGLFRKNISLLLRGNLLTGPIPRSLSQAHASFIDVSNNKLTGDASVLLGRKKGFIQDIDLSSNQLKFNFSKVGFPVDLRYINLSHNMIYGSFPNSWGPLRLRGMDVSYNKLCGPIPNGKRWRRFNPIYYAHNKCLCGAPLRPCK